MVEEDMHSLVLGDCLNLDLEPEESVYEEVKSIDEFYTVAEIKYVWRSTTIRTKLE